VVECATGGSSLRSPLKRRTAAWLGLLSTPKFAAAAKLTGLQVAGVVTVSVNAFVVVGPLLPLKAVTVTVYVPAGCGSVTRRLPVFGSASSFPLKLVDVETFMLVVFVGGTLRATVVSPLSRRDVSG